MLYIVGAVVFGALGVVIACKTDKLKWVFIVLCNILFFFCVFNGLMELVL